MSGNRSTGDGVAGYLHDVLFSTTMAASTLTVAVHGTIYWSAQFFGWEMGFNSSLGKSRNDLVGQALAFCAWSLAFAVLVFLLLRAIERVSFVRRALRAVGGAVVLAAAPTCLWFVSYWPHVYARWFWLPLEGYAAVGCAVLYAGKRWPFGRSVTVLLLTLHGALWGGAYMVEFDAHGLCWLTVPVAAYFSTLVWGREVRRYRLLHG
jgi:uncharacterized membrane protein